MFINILYYIKLKYVKFLIFLNKYRHLLSILILLLKEFLAAKIIYHHLNKLIEAKTILKIVIKDFIIK